MSMLTLDDVVVNPSSLMCGDLFKKVYAVMLQFKDGNGHKSLPTPIGLYATLDAAKESCLRRMLDVSPFKVGIYSVSELYLYD